MGLRVPLLCMNEVWEFGRVTNEEHWGVVANHVPIAFLCVEFDSKAARITSSVCRAPLSSDSRESSQDGSSLANTIQEFRLAIL